MGDHNHMTSQLERLKAVRAHVRTASKALEVGDVHALRGALCGAIEVLSYAYRDTYTLERSADWLRNGVTREG